MKISELNPANLPLTGTEQVPIVQTGETVRVSTSDVLVAGGAALRANNLSDLTNLDTANVNLGANGITTIALSNTDVTLTTVQARKDIVILTGVLTANVNVIFPTTQKRWVVINNTTGLFAVTCKTLASAGSIIAQGGRDIFHYDGAILDRLVLKSTSGYTNRTLYNVNTQLTSADAGTVIHSSVAGTVLTLPPASNVPLGASISFSGVVLATGVITINRSGSDTINMGTASVTSLTLGPGDTLEIYSIPGTGWVASRGSAAIQYSTNGKSLMVFNRIFNGDMRIDQRFGGVAQTFGVTSYLLDRWFIGLTQVNRLQTGQNLGAFTPPDGFTNYLGAKTVLAQVLGAGDSFNITQRIEGFNFSDFGFGTPNAKTITVSFLVHTSITGLHSGALRNGADNRSYPFSFTVSQANTWTPVSITIPGDTTGTWTANNTTGASLVFSLGVGTTGSSTAGSWQAGNFSAVTGAVSIVSTLNATFNITGVQVEEGKTSTNFQRRSYSQELRLCRRYFYVMLNTQNFWSGNTTSGSIYYVHYQMQDTMRIAPTTSAVTSLAQNGFAGPPTTSVVASDFVQFQNTANATVSGGFYYAGCTLSAEL